MKLRFILVLSLISVAPLWNAAAKAPVTDCDRLAAHPRDVNRVIPGVGFEQMDAPRAIAACRDAVANFPDEPRFAYQLARALDRDNQVLAALEMYRRLADQGYVQAQVTMGLSYLDGTFPKRDPALAFEWF